MNKRIEILLTFVVYTFIFCNSQERFVGGDLSMLPKYEEADVAYFDASGNRISDLLDYLKNEAGFSVVRIRLFVNPTYETGVVQDLDYVVSLSRRVKEKGMKVLLDFHYSDTWADPKGQWTPLCWEKLYDDALMTTISEYTSSVLNRLKSESAAPDYIQIGNEVSFGMLWGAKGDENLKKCFIDNDDNWQRFVDLLSGASSASRAVCPDSKIIIHTERTADPATTQAIYSRLSDVDYDIIALSYYPEWHNDISTLVSNLTNLQSVFPDKELLIAETGYPNNWYPQDAAYDLTDEYPATPLGQKKFLSDLVDRTLHIENLIGILYWFPEENPYGNHVYEPWFNHGLFDPETGKVGDALFELKRFVEDGGVATVEKDEKCGNVIFDIMGRRVLSSGNMSKGVYITNGKTIIIK